ncbi:uncharacterized protein LOC133189443 [Saccostrea echinata]|uniref:uncharacterized protein LOC133189443 n=1 Tax=Saccostrea echinata TaxID=191078 RepID=UPI002A802131|nr:uncharacterized protein LOC133189443 [Saccostrea echinata]
MTKKKKKKSKVTLVASLRQKLKDMRRPKKSNAKNQMSESDSDVEEHIENTINPYKGNQNATKESRKIKLGIKSKLDDTFVNIRVKKGGGPRDITVKKSSKKKELIEQAKELYFGKSGTSKLGCVDDFSFDMQNFEEDILDDEISVGKLYEQTGLSKLTFYLLLIPACKYEDLPKIQRPLKRPRTTNSSISDDDENLPDPSEVVSFDILSEAMLAADVPLCFQEPNINLDYVEDSSCINTVPAACNSTNPASCISTVHSEELVSINSPLSLRSNASQHLENLVPAAITVPQEISLKTDKVLRIHRVTLLDEMLVFFKDPEIMNKNITFEFVSEHGSDMNGVSRDAYSAFWIEFFRRSAEGEESRVPALNSKWQGDEWQAIGRLFAKGFVDQNVFPIQMSPVTTIVVSFGEASVTDKILNDAFLSYISKTERDTLSSALNKETFDEEMFDDLLDLLDRFSCKQRPTKENLHSLLNNIAHKELIQKPKYATDNMALGCRDALLSHFLSVEKILITYQDMEPTPKKVLKMIEAIPKGHSEATSLRYLQQYIRGQSSVSLKKLLRFLSGSEAITVDKIEVTFTQLEGLGRRPIAHTCGPLLELPSTYLSYPELRNELDSILADDSCFVMNMA